MSDFDSEFQLPISIPIPMSHSDFKSDSDLPIPIRTDSDSDSISIYRSDATLAWLCATRGGRLLASAGPSAEGPDLARISTAFDCLQVM